jgi:signal transduction histidine kinase
MRWNRFNHIDLLRWAGLFTYACVGLPLLVETVRPPAAMEPLETAALTGWAVAYAIFGLSYWSLTHDLGSPRRSIERYALLLVMSISAIAINYFSRSGVAGILLMVMAGVLPWIMPIGWGLAWLLGETLAMVPGLTTIQGWSWFDAFFQSALWLGFSSFAFVTSLVAKGQAEAREEQRRLNAELRATRALLAESTRMNERVRISRELHDLLGHHLTALSLNLEVAAHLAQGNAQEHVRKAQALAKLLLSDVREVVSVLRQDDDIDLARALRALIEGLPEPAVHLEFEQGFKVDDPRRAQVLLRCAQEMVTNTIRHARAKNLWLKFERDAEGKLCFRARDDGQGTDALNRGNGLSGMQERLAQVGGGLTIETARGRGFRLEAWIPQEAKS